MALTETYAQQINCVHIADRIDPQRGFSDRTFPGDGVIDIQGFIAACERGGFEGWYDVEIFAGDGLEHDGDAALWRLPADEIVQRSRAGFDRVWAGARELLARTV
jgi:sugar phosphate isomerase/epimerase